MGHKVETQTRQGDAHTIWIAPDGTPYGVNDRRTADSKASTPAHLLLAGPPAPRSQSRAARGDPSAPLRGAHSYSRGPLHPAHNLAPLAGTP
jgi:hypothetical protein